MMEGKIHSALRFSNEESQGGIHQLSEKILNDLHQQHPVPTEIQLNSLLFGPICDLRDIRFDIDEQKIAEAVQLTKGAAGLPLLMQINLKESSAQSNLMKKRKTCETRFPSLLIILQPK